MLAYNKKHVNLEESISCLNPELYETLKTNATETFKMIGKIHFKISVEEKETMKIKQIKIKGLPESNKIAGLYFRSVYYVFS